MNTFRQIRHTAPTFRFPSVLKPDPSSLAMASLRLRTSSGGVFCFDLNIKFILDDVVKEPGWEVKGRTC